MAPMSARGASRWPPGGDVTTHVMGANQFPTRRLARTDRLRVNVAFMYNCAGFESVKEIGQRAMFDLFFLDD